MFIDNPHVELTNVRHEPKVQWEPVGYPIRCRTCNKRYNAYKRAAEAVERLEIVRKTYADFGGAKWRYLKFVTMTFPIVAGDDPEPPLEEITEKYLKARSHLIEKIEVLGGTGVMECVSYFGREKYYDKKAKEERWKGVEGKWTHNVHFHDLWLAPYVNNDRLQEEFLEAGVGRFEYTILEEETWENDRGEERVKLAHRVAISYLSKYLTKCDGSKRKVFGELRKWKDYLPDDVCRTCTKTTHDVRKEHPCKCESKEHPLEF